MPDSLRTKRKRPGIHTTNDVFVMQEVPSPRCGIRMSVKRIDGDLLEQTLAGLKERTQQLLADSKKLEAIKLAIARSDRLGTSAKELVERIREILEG